jgi:hypothetical protein
MSLLGATVAAGPPIWRCLSLRTTSTSALIHVVGAFCAGIINAGACTMTLSGLLLQVGGSCPEDAWVITSEEIAVWLAKQPALAE